MHLSHLQPPHQRATDLQLVGRGSKAFGHALATLLLLVCVGCQASPGDDIGDGNAVELSASQRAQEYLDVALEAEAWIASTAQETDDGIAWPDHVEEPEVILTSLYHGTPGIVLFYLELHRSTGKSGYLDTALHGARDLAARTQRQIAAGDVSVALHGGLSGVAFVLSEAGRAGSDSDLSDAAKTLFQRVRDHAEKRGTGIAWMEPMPFWEMHGNKDIKEVLDMTHGATGMGLAFLYAAETGLLPEANDWAMAVGDRLIEVAEEVPGGLQWQMVPDMPIDFNSPNFSHGTAGIAYFLARLHEVSGEQRFLDAALAGAERLRTIATVEETDQGTSRLIYHHEGAGEERYYLSWCHGPAGTGRLFRLLAQLTEDPSWDDWLVGGLTGIRATGAPEVRSEGYWNNISQCCGDTGVGEFSLSLYTVTKDTQHLDYAERIARYLDGAKTDVELEAGGRGACWVQAEHRNRPEFLKAHTGYMQGAAGVGSYLLRLHAVLTEQPDPKLHWPDSPFG